MDEPSCLLGFMPDDSCHSSIVWSLREKRKGSRVKEESKTHFSSIHRPSFSYQRGVTPVYG